MEIRCYKVRVQRLQRDELLSYYTDELEPLPKASLGAEDNMAVTPQTMSRKSSTSRRLTNKAADPQIHSSKKVQKPQSPLITPARVPLVQEEWRTGINNSTNKGQGRLLHSENSTSNISTEKPSKMPGFNSTGQFRVPTLRSAQTRKAPIPPNKPKDAKNVFGKDLLSTSNQSRIENRTIPSIYSNISTGTKALSKFHFDQPVINSVQRPLKSNFAEHLLESGTIITEHFSSGVSRQLSGPPKEQSWVNRISESLEPIGNQNSLVGKIHQFVELSQNSTFVQEKDSLLDRRNSLLAQGNPKAQSFSEKLNEGLKEEMGPNRKEAATLGSVLERPLFNSTGTDMLGFLDGTRPTPSEDSYKMNVKTTKVKLLAEQDRTDNISLTLVDTPSQKVVHLHIEPELTTQRQFHPTTPTKSDVAMTVNTHSSQPGQNSHKLTHHKIQTHNQTGLESASKSHTHVNSQNGTHNPSDLSTEGQSKPAKQNQTDRSVVPHIKNERGSQNRTRSNVNTQHIQHRVTESDKPPYSVLATHSTHIHTTKHKQRIANTTIHLDRISKTHLEHITVIQTESENATQIQPEVRSQNQVEPETPVKLKTQQQTDTKTDLQLNTKYVFTTQFHPESEEKVTDPELATHTQHIPTTLEPSTLTQQPLATTSQTELTTQNKTKLLTQTPEEPYRVMEPSTQNNKLTTHGTGNTNHSIPDIYSDTTLQNSPEIATEEHPKVWTSSQTELDTQTQPESYTVNHSAPIIKHTPGINTTRTQTESTTQIKQSTQTEKEAATHNHTEPSTQTETKTSRHHQTEPSTQTETKTSRHHPTEPLTQTERKTSRHHPTEPLTQTERKTAPHHQTESPRQTESKTAIHHQTEPLTQTESKTTIHHQTESPTQTESKTAIHHQTKPSTQTESKTATHHQTDPLTQTESKTAIHHQTESPTQTESKTAIHHQTKPSTQTESKTATHHQTDPLTQTESKTAIHHQTESPTQTESKTAIHHQTKPSTQTESKTATHHQTESPRQTESKTATHHQTEPSTQTKTATHHQTEPSTQTKTATHHQTEPSTQTELKTAIHHQTEPSTQTELKTAIHHQTEPSTQTEPNTTTQQQIYTTPQIEQKTQQQTQSSTHSGKKTSTQNQTAPSTQTQPTMVMHTRRETSTQSVSATQSHPEPFTQSDSKATTQMNPETTTQTEPNSFTQTQSGRSRQTEWATQTHPVTHPELSVQTESPIQIKPNSTTHTVLRSTTQIKPESFTQQEPESTTQMSQKPSTHLEIGRPTQSYPTQFHPSQQTQPELETQTQPHTNSQSYTEPFTKTESGFATQTPSDTFTKNQLTPIIVHNPTTYTQPEQKTHSQTELPAQTATQMQQRPNTKTQLVPSTQNNPKLATQTEATHTMKTKPGPVIMIQTTQTAHTNPEQTIEPTTYTEEEAETYTYRDQTTQTPLGASTYNNSNFNTITETMETNTSDNTFAATNITGMFSNATIRKIPTTTDGSHGGPRVTSKHFTTDQEPKPRNNLEEPTTKKSKLLPQPVSTSVQPRTHWVPSTPSGRDRIFIVDEQLPVFKVERINVTYRMQLNLATSAPCEQSDPCQTRVLQEVTSLYESVPGFDGIEVPNVTLDKTSLEYRVQLTVQVGSVMSELQEHLLRDPSWLFGSAQPSQNNLRSRIRSISLAEHPADPCTDWFSCPEGFQCVSAPTLIARCTSPCHRNYCHNHGICIHQKGNEPECQCPVGRDFWYMGHRCDYRMTHLRLAAIACAVVFCIIICAAVTVFLLVRRFQHQILQQKVAQTQSSYRRFSRFDDVPTQFWCPSQTWLTTSASLNSLDNPAFSSSEEVFPLQALGSCVCGCQDGAQSCAQTNPPQPPARVPPRLETSCSSVNDLMIDSGKASDVSVSSWPMEPIHWTPFPILHQLSLQSPFHARRPHSYFEGMELVNTERSWTA
ncbi:uncharacterized protein O3C94_019003 [Discoglossus pictus]